MQVILVFLLGWAATHFVLDLGQIDGDEPYDDLIFVVTFVLIQIFAFAAWF
jgi:hypothetical protein